MITVIYVLVSLSAVAYNGADSAAAADPATFYVAIVTSALGDWSGHAVSVLLPESLFTTLLAVHNMAARYFYGLAGQRLLPTSLGAVNRRGAPSRSRRPRDSRGRGGDGLRRHRARPLLNLAPTMFGIGTVAIVAPLPGMQGCRCS